MTLHLFTPQCFLYRMKNTFIPEPPVSGPRQAFAGDIPTYARMPKEERYKLEEFGIRYIESLLQLVDPKLGAAIRAGWEEYENGNTPKATPEGKWVREMDKFECMIQAHEYEQRTYGEKNLEEFQGQAKYIKSEEGKKMLELLQQEREAHFQKRKQRTPVIFILEVKFPTQLAISLLESKINEGMIEGKRSLVRGFPENIEQLDEFKRKIRSAGSAEEVFPSVKKAVEEFIQHERERSI
ncbi:hypothetical protein DL95DRAFT_439565 [Leptodontidium sp. 2 PMI_412]|nr:hypothetical protein DL95DRAFT_439565 [Leptodontidium sp. 2 PMI_412]